MSCNARNYNTHPEYDKHMKNTYHSPPWVENASTRTHFDLDLQKKFGTHLSKRKNKLPWDAFNNVLEGSVEKYEPLSGFRSQYDLDMQNAFDQNVNNDNQNPIGDFDNVIIDPRVLEMYRRR